MKVEFQDLCSSCHNIDMKIAPDIPEKAVNAFDNAEKLKNEIRIADDAIKQAKQQGKDVTVAQKELDSAIAIQDNLPILWHSFNLPHFQNVTDSGIIYARTSQTDSGLPPDKAFNSRIWNNIILDRNNFNIPADAQKIKEV